MIRTWPAASVALRQELKDSLNLHELRKLHVRHPWRHFAIVFRQFILLVGATWGLLSFSHPLSIVLLATIQGFTIFNFTVLLHEVVHHTVFPVRKRFEKWNKVLGFLYALPSGLSPTQFTQWHLDHHAELGSEEKDPKRHHLSPKKNKRSIKLLYFTPVLFPIYFRAARRETETYPEHLQKRIRLERRLALALHLIITGILYAFGGPGALMKVYILPVFFVFPVAFALNRLGQHYNIKPDDPAQWTTLVKSSWFWNFWFLNSNFHLEHHYFPGVPLYNLPKLHRMLQPFYQKKGMKAYSYLELFYRYIILNEAPHTDWEKKQSSEVPAQTPA